VSVQPEFAMIRARIEQLRNDVHRVRHEEVERMEAVKARREQQRQDAMANFITLSDIVKPMPKPEAR